MKAKGAKEYEKHQTGEVLTKTQAILAHCYECNGFHEDKNRDCGCVDCVFYPYFPYRRDKKSKGSKNLTDEERKAIGKRLQQGRQKNVKT